MLFFHGRTPPYHQSQFNTFFIFSISFFLYVYGSCAVSYWPGLSATPFPSLLYFSRVYVCFGVLLRARVVRSTFVSIFLSACLSGLRLSFHTLRMPLVLLGAGMVTFWSVSFFLVVWAICALGHSCTVAVSCVGVGGCGETAVAVDLPDPR